MRSVTLGKCAPNKQSDMLHTISSLCSNIESIDVNFCAPTDSFKCFMDSIPVNLTKLSLCSQEFSHSSLLTLLSKCRQMKELRIGQYVGAPDASTQLVHQGLQLFRFSCKSVAFVAPVLSAIVPNLVTLIVLALTRNSYECDTSANVVLILNSFRYLRQLIMDQPDAEHKLSQLSALPTVTATAQAKRKTVQLPEAGNLLEELFSERVFEAAKTIKFPALRSVGCEKLYLFFAPSPAVK